MSRTRTRVVEQQLDLVALIAYAEPGAQLDLVEEIGVERVGPSTIASHLVRVPGLADLGPYTLDAAMLALRTYRALGLTDAQIVEG